MQVRANEQDGQAAATPLADEAVVQRVLAGDVAAFELLMRRYNQRLFRIARSVIGEDAEAEDIVQEAYLRAYKNLGQFEQRAKFSTWLTKIAVHEASARRRKQSRLRLVTPSETEAIPEQLPHADERASQKELEVLLTQAIDALPTDLRLVFTLRMVEQLSTELTAECLDISTANVKIRLHRARSQLKKWIDSRIGEESRRLYQFDGERCDRIVNNVMPQILNR
jgi:RNA polymerase sigma-70 factor, ECF subfamily